MIWFFPAFGMGIFTFLPEIMLIQGFEMRDTYLISGYCLVLPMVGVLISSFFIDAFGRKQLIAI